MNNLTLTHDAKLTSNAKVWEYETFLFRAGATNV